MLYELFGAENPLLITDKARQRNTTSKLICLPLTVVIKLYVMFNVPS